MLLNRSEIRFKVRILIGDSGPTGGAWMSGPPQLFTQDAYNRFINDALREIYAMIPYPEIEETFDVVANQATYSSKELTVIEHVDYDDKPLPWITPDALEHMDELWRTRTGEPRFVMLNGDVDWANEYDNTSVADTTDKRQFTLYPAPTDTTVDIRAIGRWFPTDLYSDFVAPALPSWLCDAVVFEAAARILESSVEERNDDLAAAYRGLRDWYVGQGLEKLGNRTPTKVVVKGEYTRLPGTLVRDTHIPVTGVAPGDPE